MDAVFGDKSVVVVVVQVRTQVLAMSGTERGLCMTGGLDPTVVRYTSSSLPSSQAAA